VETKSVGFTFTFSLSSGERKQRNVFVKKVDFFLDNITTLCHNYVTMKTRQSKKSEYHRFAIQIPLDLWEKLQLKAEANHKSYSAFIVEILRNTLKESNG